MTSKPPGINGSKNDNVAGRSAESISSAAGGCWMRYGLRFIFALGVNSAILLLSRYSREASYSSPCTQGRGLRVRARLAECWVVSGRWCELWPTSGPLAQVGAA